MLQYFNKLINIWCLFMSTSALSSSFCFTTSSSAGTSLSATSLSSSSSSTSQTAEIASILFPLQNSSSSSSSINVSFVFYNENGDALPPSKKARYLNDNEVSLLRSMPRRFPHNPYLSDSDDENSVSSSSSSISTSIQTNQVASFTLSSLQNSSSSSLQSNNDDAPQSNKRVKFTHQYSVNDEDSDDVEVITPDMIWGRRHNPYLSDTETESDSEESDGDFAPV